MSGVEVNGPANIITFIDIARRMNGGQDNELLDRIEREALATIEYMQHLENPENVKWSDIKKGAKV